MNRRLATSYRLHAGQGISVQGPLALVAPQARELARHGKTVHVTDADGYTVSISEEHGRLITIPVGQISLLDPNKNPDWPTRLVGIANQTNQGETQ